MELKQCREIPRLFLCYNLSMWHVYMVRCVDGTYYTGTTTELNRRVEEHNSSDLAAKYTRTRRPVVLVYSIGVKNKSAALKLEARIKKSSRLDKIALVRRHNDYLKKQANKNKPRI